MEYLNNKEAFDAINAMTDAELVELLKSPELSLPYDLVNGVLIDRENIIFNLTGINPSPNVKVTYTWNGEKKEEIRQTDSPGCSSCGK